jgi:putative oxidoreductase
VAGLYLALAHGWGKVLGLSTGESRMVQAVAGLGFPLPVLFAWAAALSELVGGLAVGLGLFTRWAAGFAGFTMLVAGFLQHRALSRFLSWIGVSPATEEQLQAWGNPEMALLYLMVFVSLALLGPGRFAIDARLRK